MHNPIAYTYEADTHCPPCTIARFGRAQVTTYSDTVSADYPPESARDTEGNPVGAIFGFDEWCEPSEPGTHTLWCGTCHSTIREHDEHAPVTFPPRWGPRVDDDGDDDFDLPTTEDVN